MKQSNTKKILISGLTLATFLMQANGSFAKEQTEIKNSITNSSTTIAQKNLAQGLEGSCCCTCPGEEA